MDGGTLDRSKAREIFLAWCLLGLAFFGFVLAYQAATPLGEAPDEPAHLAYVRSLVLEGWVEIPSAPSDLTYELHQPPLAYIVAALNVRLTLGSQAAAHVPELPRSEDFDFRQPTKRYVAAPFQRPGASWIRATQLFWAALFFCGLFACAAAHPAPGMIATGVFAAFLLSPQILFSFATFNNDAAAIALSTLALALILRRGRWWLIASVASLALWAKLSAVFLGVPLLVEAWRRRKPAILILWGSGAAALLAVQSARSAASSSFALGSWGLPSGRLADLFDPGWLVTLGTSFWAKLGWFNVPLPAAAYVLFLAPSGFVIAGAIRALKQKQREDFMALLATLAIFALLLVFLVLVDWQPQGRLLLPAVAAVAWLAASGARGIAPPESGASGMSRSLRLQLAVALLVVGGLLAAFSGLWALKAAYV